MLVHAYIIILLSETLHTRGRWNDGEKEKRFARTPTDARAQKSLLSLKYNNIVCKDCGSCVTGTDGEVQYKCTVPIHTMRRARVSSEAISKYTRPHTYTHTHTRNMLTYEKFVVFVYFETRRRETWSTFLNSFVLSRVFEPRKYDKPSTTTQ